MTFDPARPRYTLPFAGTEYELLGTFGLIEAVEYALKANVGVVAVQLVRGMPSFELAKVLSAVLTACGHPTTPADTADKLWTVVGLTGEANESLRLHLYDFLSICLAPPGEREGKAREAGEHQQTLRALFPGSDTARSASASSAGDQATSGPPTPGA